VLLILDEERWPAHRFFFPTDRFAVDGILKTLVVIPTYNEAENIDDLLSAVWQECPDLQILVVDDNSADGTGKLVKNRQLSAAGKLHILERAGKLGLGTAYICGFHWALENGFAAVIEMDADFSHDPKILPTMVAELQNYPVVVGSRYVAGGGTQNWNWFRKLISRCGSLYARTILGVKIADLTGGFNGWRREVLEKIGLERVESEGYAFQIELKYRAARCGFAIHEIPIVFCERRAGYSKMSGKIVLEAILRVWRLRLIRTSKNT